MKRYIDADALIPMMKYATTDSEVGIFPIRIGFDAIEKVIDETPTADVVEVVRCGECIYGVIKGHVTQFMVCEFHDDIATDPYNHCSWGKRREP